MRHAARGALMAATLLAGCEVVPLIAADAGTAVDGGTSDGGVLDDIDAGRPEDAGVPDDDDAGVVDPGPPPLELCRQPRGPATPHVADGSEDYLDPAGDQIVGLGDPLPEADVLATWSRVEERDGERVFVMEVRTAAPAVLTLDQTGIQVLMGEADGPEGCGIRPVPNGIPIFGGAHHGISLSPGFRGAGPFLHCPTVPSRTLRGCDHVFVSRAEPRLWRAVVPCERDGIDVCGLDYDFMFKGKTIAEADSRDISSEASTGTRRHIVSRGGRPPVDDFVSICAFTCPGAE